MLILVRDVFHPQRTLGRIFIDGNFQCFTVEDTVRDGPKIPGSTAIPEGTYQILITESQRFKRPLPLLLNVPQFSGIRIHSGNTEADTEGCILVGQQRSKTGVLYSRAAMRILQARIAAVLAVTNGTCFITITSAPTPDAA